LFGLLQKGTFGCLFVFGAQNQIFMAGGDGAVRLASIVSDANGQISCSSMVRLFLIKCLRNTRSKTGRAIRFPNFCIIKSTGTELTKLHFDPELLPIDSLAGEAAVTPDCLTADALRARFAHPPVWSPEITVERLVRPMTGPLTKAAVLLPIVMRADGPTLLLTQRTAHLNAHAGQISFPGGRMETSDTSPIDTALRETDEEIGLDRRHIEVLGTLPDYQTGTGFRVTPVVGIIELPFETKADPFEVAEIFEVPLSFLMNGMHHERRTAEFATGRRTFYVMQYDRFFIWGATAGMLRNLFHFLRA
jgi:8-oxo-dGTP pyrophosphatase MutT (NUDIX family)